MIIDKLQPLVATFRNHQLSRGIRSRLADYSIPDERQNRSHQLELWNREWQRLVNNVPHYRDLFLSKSMPSRFSCWEEFIDTVPPTSRTIVKNHAKTMISNEHPPESMRITGGSTAEPIQIPAWNSETAFTRYDMWLGRSWYGITPASRLFLLWGHSHLLGSGRKGRINAFRREIYDSLLGYYRCSAYDLQPTALRKAGEELVKFRPEYILGYSVALDNFARVNRDLTDMFRDIGVRAVIATAESFPADDSISSLQHLFGCPVAMEYGAVETRLIAHSVPEGGYQVFWCSYFVEAERMNILNSRSYKVRVTSLYPRCFPLVRYEIGDEIELLTSATDHSFPVMRFHKVFGRCNDYIELEDGSVIHSEAFSHAVRWCPNITGYQVVQNREGVRIDYTANSEMPAQTLSEIRRKLSIIHPLLRCIGLKRVERLEQTIAGKTLMVLKKP